MHVFSDSVLCIDGKCPPYPESIRVWEQDKISNFISTPKYRIGQHRWRTVCVRVEDFSQGREQNSFSKSSRSWRLYSGFSRRTSRTSSYLGQCTTTLIGPQKQREYFRQQFITSLWVGQEVTLNFARSWRRRKMGRSPRNPMEHGIEQQRRWCWTSRRASKRCSEEQPVLWQEKHWKVRELEQCRYTSMRNPQRQNCVCFAQFMPPISSVFKKQ